MNAFAKLLSSLEPYIWPALQELEQKELALLHTEVHSFLDQVFKAIEHKRKEVAAGGVNFASDKKSVVLSAK